jgi:hypothetical protein
MKKPDNSRKLHSSKAFPELTFFVALTGRNLVPTHFIVVAIRGQNDNAQKHQFVLHLSQKAVLLWVLLRHAFDVKLTNERV